MRPSSALAVFPTMLYFGMSPFLRRVLARTHVLGRASTATCLDRPNRRAQHHSHSGTTISEHYLLCPPDVAGARANREAGAWIVAVRTHRTAYFSSFRLSVVQKDENVTAAAWDTSGPERTTRFCLLGTATGTVFLLQLERRRVSRKATLGSLPGEIIGCVGERVPPGSCWGTNSSIPCLPQAPLGRAARCRLGEVSIHRARAARLHGRVRAWPNLVLPFAPLLTLAESFLAQSLCCRWTGASRGFLW